MKGGRLLELLRCPLCGSALEMRGERAHCPSHSFPIENGIPRLLPPDLMGLREGHDSGSLRSRTYRSFAFEWSHFSHQLPAYRENFRWYMEPLPVESLRGLLVLDAGCGMGRHTFHLLGEGAEVLGLDASPAVDVAALNNPGGEAVFVQGDVCHLPVQEGSFDLACCLGVLHHIEDTARGLGELVRAVRPGGWVVVYVYHQPSELGRVRGALLRLVTLARTVTTRLPFPLLSGLTWVLSVGLFVGYVGPAKVLSRIHGLGPRLRSLPLGQYIDYPFRTLWNDQFDRFSAPLEKRYRRAEVEELMRAAGLADLRILGGYGWRAAGRRPAAP